MSNLQPLRFILATCAFLLCFQASASNVSISPTSLRANDTTKAQLITLKNASSVPAKYQVQVYTWSQVDGQDVMEPTRKLIASPSTVEIAPGATQVVRVVRMEGATGKSTYFRVIARELPGTINPTRPGVSMLINHSIPASFEPVSAGVPSLTLSRRGKELAITNAGSTAARLTEISSSEGKSFRKGALGWVLPGSMKLVPVDTGSTSELVLTVNGNPQKFSVN